MHIFLRGKYSLTIGCTCTWVFPMCFIGKKYFYGTYEETYTGLPQVLESPGICWFSWKILEKSWNFTLSIRWIFFLQVVYMSFCQVVMSDIPQVFSLFVYLIFTSSLYEFLPSCYVRYSTSFFLVCVPVSELKYKKCCNLLSHNYFLFTFDRKYLKIFVFSKWDGLKMNGASIGLGKKWHRCIM